ncbi:MAG: histidine phosphatase family protein [Planctomycetes bacterium]|nr:histidine phosphatase family protein [Planctomycetota bacterium]
MQRRLIVMRHAKSSWKEPGQEDHERPLNKRGRRDAPRIAAELAERGWAPATVLCSSAVRTQETWGLMQAELESEADLELRSDFYLAGLDAVRDALEELPDAASPVLVLGHNPGWESMASTLAGEPIGMTTANAVLLEGEGESWPLALAGPWRVAAVLRPKELDPEDD